MSKHVSLAFAAVLAIAALAPPAQGHVMPWRDGDARTKEFGGCAKGPCMKRYDFSKSKPHHHHGKRVMVGSNRHTWRCRRA
jgi:hypothetical protein